MDIIRKINLSTDDLNFQLAGIKASIDVDADDFCLIFAALQAKTLTAPDSTGSWCVITPNSSTRIRSVIKLETGELMVQLGKNLRPPTAGRWVKLMDLQ